MKKNIFESVTFLNEGIFQKLNKLGNNDRFLRMWSGGNNYAKYAGYKDPESGKQSKAKSENQNEKYISKDLETKLQGIVNDVLPKAKKIVTDGINSLPDDYKNTTTDQTAVLKKIEVQPAIYGDNSVSKENPAIILLCTYWFDGDVLASNNGIEENDNIEAYVNKNEQKIKSRLSKIDNSVIKLFSGSGVKLYTSYVSEYLSWGSFIYTTLNDVKKAFNI